MEGMKCIDRVRNEEIRTRVMDSEQLVNTLLMEKETWMGHTMKEKAVLRGGRKMLTIGDDVKEEDNNKKRACNKSECRQQ